MTNCVEVTAWGAIEMLLSAAGDGSELHVLVDTSDDLAAASND
jgi:hypothetical protein